MPIRQPINKPNAPRAQRHKDYDSRRGTSSQRGYGSRWQKARASFLSDPDNCLCRMCLALGRVNDGRYRLDGSHDPNPRRRSLHVDHITPHKGDQSLFWDKSNWQALCPDHHDIIKQAEERGQPIRTIGEDGWPL